MGDVCNREGELTLKDIKLVQYLARNKHTSPFNHSFLTVRVKAPIFVARQLGEA
jgi:thymidylate synthase (FAD)